MNETPFRTGGALTDDHADIYIERQADRKALTHLRAMDYLLVIEPRQQGKTSLINHLMRHPALNNAAFAYVDVTTPDGSSEAAWYQTLCPRILRQLRDFIPRSQKPSIPKNSASWREFLCDVAICAADAQKCTIIALDEIGAVTFPGATAFFSVLRDVYNSRQAEAELKQLTFLLAGAFHPRDLIKDDKISPFNVAQRVRLTDFTFHQVRELVGKGPWAKDQAIALAERIHYWTDGQPYLTQLLCSYLGPEAVSADVDAGIERLRREDENHLPPLMDRLEQDKELSQYVQRILSGEQFKFYPQEHRRQAELELLGVIKEGPEGYCKIRNRIYKRSLSSNSMTASAPYPEQKVKVGLIRSEWADRQPNFKEVKFRGKRLTGVKTDRGNSATFYDLYLLPSGKYLVYTEYATWDDASSDVHGPLGVKRLQSEFPELAIQAGLVPQITLSEEGKIEQKSIKSPSSSPEITDEKPMSNSELDDILRRRSLSLLIGADLPRDVTGLPSRADLARKLAHRKGLDESLSLAEVAQRVSQAGNRWEFTAFIRDQLDTTGQAPQPFHRRIIGLVQEHQIETLITTAYDNLLELAFQEAGVPINRVVRGSDVSFIAPDRPTLIKLYGDVQQPDTLVVTEDDHYGLWRDRDKEDLLQEVRTVLRRQTVLFLGYNLADPDFNLLWREVLDRAGRFNRTAYAVWPGLPEGEVQMWRDRGIVILEVDPLGTLDDLLATPSNDRTRPPSVEAISAKETLYLDTTATTFAQWLAEYTRLIPYRSFLTARGRLVLQSIKQPDSIKAPKTLPMDTFYILTTENESAETAQPTSAAITFRVIPLTSERVEVHAECRQRVVLNYFRELLSDIKQRWPVKDTTSTRALKSTVDGLVYDFIEHFDKANRIAEMVDPQFKLQIWNECYCGGESTKAIFAHPHPLHGCKFKYTIRNIPAAIKSVRLDFSIGIPDKSNFTENDSLAFKIILDDQEKWCKQWNKKQWDHNSIEEIKIGSDRTLEVMFVTDDMGNNVSNWAVWGSPVLIVEELETIEPPFIETAKPSREDVISLSVSPVVPRFLAHVKLQLARLVGPEFEARVFESPIGEARATAHLPYSHDDLIAILKALPAPSLEAARLTPAQAEALRDLGLLTNSGPVADLHAQVGQALYQALFPANVGAAFHVASTQVRSHRGVVALQLRFDEDAVALARYPWELLYHRRHLLPGGAVELTRYISYPEAPTTLSLEPPLRVLYVESRPTDLEALPRGEEQKTVRTALEALHEQGQLVLEILSPPTYDALIDRVEGSRDHVLHFDGHGTVARRCPACGAMNYPHHVRCQDADCDRTLTDVSPLGYLAFETEGSRQVDWVDSKALEHLLYPSTVRVAMLSACRSGEVRGETLFGGVGPALIQAGVPAVVAMQVPITVPAAVRFMQGFYRALARFEPLATAMTSGRRRLFRGREWFIPALYLRSRDDRGQLFQASL